MYLVVRADLTPGQQMAQILHAYRGFVDQFRDLDEQWFKESNYVCVLEVPDQDALLRLAKLADSKRLKYYLYDEPDFEGAWTAMCLEPGDASKRITSSLRLAGKGR